jgi:hypothetical protein
MTPAGRVRALLLGVAVVAGLLVLASRWAGRAPEPDPAAGTDGAPELGDGRDGATLKAGALPEAVPDLSFYRVLGSAGDRHAAPPTAGAGAPEAIVPRATATSPGNPGGAYVVQALATRDRAAARRLRDRLAARGLPAAVVEGRAGGSPVYRVRVGRYRERAAAEVVARRTRAVSGASPWVLRESE